jgi:hypothetical protein
MDRIEYVPTEKGADVLQRLYDGEYIPEMIRICELSSKIIYSI